MIIYGSPAILMSLTEEEKDRLLNGKAVARGSKVYAVCRGCQKLIRINKPIVGSMHVCAEENE